MSHKILTFLILTSFILTSCGTTVSPENTWEIKKPFLVDTKISKDFNKNYTLEKSWRLVGSSTISLVSQGVGRVTSIGVKEWSVVKKWETLIRLQDTTANYDIRLAQAKNALKNTEVSIESTKLQLDKTITDAQFALEKAKADLQMTQDDAVKKLEKAERDVNKSLVSATGSDAKIALEKAELDYANLQASNLQTIKNFNASYILSVNDLQKLIAKLLYQGDKTFGMTEKFRNETTTNRQYLWARDASSRTKLEAAYMELSQKNQELAVLIPASVNESNLLIELEKLSNYYAIIRIYILATQNYIENSISSTSFPQSIIDAFTTEYIGYKTELSTLENVCTTFTNTASTFLATYKNNEASIAAGLEVQKKNLTTGEFESTLSLDRMKITIDRDITQAKIMKDSAESNYYNAISNKEITLKKLAVSLTDAELALDQAEKEFAKLSIVSPIDATVTRVNVSIGQEVSMGIPMIEIASRNPEIIFDLDSVAVNLLKIGSGQDVIYNGEVYSGTVVWVSQVANDSLLYTARLTLQKSPQYLGEVATIKLALKSNYLMLPTEIIRVIGEGQGELSILSGSTILPMSVKLWAVIGRDIEIRTPLSPDLIIITSDVSNFDAEKNIIEQRK